MASVCLVSILEDYGINMDFILGFLIAIFLYRFFIALENYAVNKRVEKATEEVMTKFREKIIPAYIEYSNGVFYMYNKSTNEFIAQGINYETLEAAAKSKHPGKMFDVVTEELSMFDK